MTPFDPTHPWRATEPSKVGQKLLEYWWLAEKQVGVAKQRLLEAQSGQATIAEELAEFLVPKNMKDGEKICMWVRVEPHREVMLEITKILIPQRFLGDPAKPIRTEYIVRRRV